MKMLKIKYCNEVLKECFYLHDSFAKKQYDCVHPEIVKKLKKGRCISKYKNNIRIPNWCPLEDYEKPKTPIIMKGEHSKR